MYTLIDECAQQFIDHFRKEEGEIIELEMKDTLTRYTNDVIATTAFGLQCNSLKDRNNDFYLMGKDGSNFGGLRSFKFFMYGSSPTLFKVCLRNVIRLVQNDISAAEDKTRSHVHRQLLFEDYRRYGDHEKREKNCSPGYDSPTTRSAKETLRRYQNQ